MSIDTVQRLEDMSPKGSLTLHKQDDGDMCLMIVESDSDGELGESACCEFCSPACGGGGSERTWKALHELFAAMKLDHEDPSQGGRKGTEFTDKF